MKQPSMTNNNCPLLAYTLYGQLGSYASGN